VETNDSRASVPVTAKAHRFQEKSCEKCKRREMQQMSMTSFGFAM
jgi:hypothetical protein